MQVGPAALAATLLVLAACAGPDAVTEEPAARWPVGERPVLVLQRPGGAVELPAWTYCYQDQSTGRAGCSDGGPPTDPPLLEADGEALFAFPEDDWAFTAEFRPVNPADEAACRRPLRIPVDREGDHYVIPALGRAGTWDVDVYGRHTSRLGVDLVTTFRWRTSIDSVVTVRRG